MIKTSTVSLERFKNAVGFTATYSCRWGNTRKAAIEKITTKGTDAEEDKKGKTRLQLKKQLIVSPDYDAIKSFMGELRAWTYGRTVPSFFKEGFQLCGLGGIDEIETRMRKAVREELPALIESFVAAYPAQIQEARTVLEPIGQFNALDYPAAEEMRGMFDISWNWIAFVTPAGLPEELRKAEEDKLQRQFADAGEQITLALRESFQKLIVHATDKLRTEPGEKIKTFRDSTIGNILEFIETFQNRNITNDAELAILVSKAKELLGGVTAQKLRDYASVRDTTLNQFTEIQKTLDGLIVEKKGRKFNLDEPEVPATTTETPAQGDLVAA